MLGIDFNVLPSHEREALRAAIDVLADDFFDDVAHLEAGGEIEDTSMFSYLPAKYVHRYDYLFAKKFTTCLLHTSWKLVSPEPQQLACVAEDLALNALIEMAKTTLDLKGQLKADDFVELAEAAYDNFNFESLFDPAQDGVEDTWVGETLQMQNLPFTNWFKPYLYRDPQEPVHPYVDDDLGGRQDGDRG